MKHVLPDVYPYLRFMCRILGLDFGTVNMRWEVREEAAINIKLSFFKNRQPFV